jgi:hypothetical protein
MAKANSQNSLADSKRKFKAVAFFQYVYILRRGRAKKSKQIAFLLVDPSPLNFGGY